MSDSLPKLAATASSRVFDHLRKDLVGGRFIAGEKLAINALKERYDVGFRRFREELSKLAACGRL
ncbi:MAG: GntR family transcriptional regulator, partial [Halomonas sp.]